MDKTSIRILGLVILTLLASCGKEQVQIPVNKVEKEDITDNLIEMNKQFFELENQEIDHYIDSLKLDMGKTISGLRYHIIQKGVGDSIKADDEVTIKYTIGALGEAPCEKLTDVVKTVTLGHSDIEKGIREAIPMMRESGEGEFILPSVIAYGVPGYGKCINGWTPVFMKLSIIEVNKKK